jgi:hypothetical protein
MRKRAVFLSILLLLQLLSAGVFIVGLYPHLANIWYNHGLGWWKSIKKEYSTGGIMFIIEIAFILLVFILTIVYEIWVLTSDNKEQKRRDAIQLAHAKKNGVTEADIQAQEELLNGKPKKKHKKHFWQKDKK